MNTGKLATFAELGLLVALRATDVPLLSALLLGIPRLLMLQRRTIRLQIPSVNKGRANKSDDSVSSIHGTRTIIEKDKNYGPGARGNKSSVVRPIQEEG